ncbi:MAG: hypothetical protein ACFBSD_03380 [Paracoccaceae bacterium]
MQDSIIVWTDRAEAGRAARWLARRLAARGVPADTADARARDFEARWSDLIALVYPRASRQMLMLSIVTTAAGVSVEIVAERCGRIAEAGARRLRVARVSGEIDGLTRLRLAA